MRHVRTRTPRTITDPATGRTYVVPQGGAEGDGGEGGESEGGASSSTETAENGEDDATSDTDPDTDTDTEGDEEGAGSKAAVLADLKRERTRRQELEAEMAELRQANESDDERRQREAAEREDEIRAEAQAPAIAALRTTAVETAAREAGFVDPADAPMMLREKLGTIDVDLESVTADRDAAAELVTELAEAKPHLVNVDSRVPPASGGSDTQRTGGTTSTDPSVTLRELAVRRLASRG